MAWIDLTVVRFERTLNCIIMKMLLDDVTLAGGAVGKSELEEAFAIPFVASSGFGTLGFDILCWAIPGSGKEARYSCTPRTLNRT